MSQRKPQSRRQKPAEMPETENDRIAGRNPVMEALRSGARIDMLYVGQESGGLQEIISLAKEQGIPVKVVTESKLTQLTGGAVQQGVAAEGLRHICFAGRTAGACCRKGRAAAAGAV